MTTTHDRYSRAEIERMVASRSFWYHKIELAPGLVTPGLSDSLRSARDYLGWPKRLDGLSVLDIGAAEGCFSFEAERRGAKVTAVDRVADVDSGFAMVRDILGSQIPHVQSTVYNLNVDRLGQFDLVLFLGVFYHLRYPLLALDLLYGLCKDLMILETQVCDEAYLSAEGKPLSLKSLSSHLVNTPMAQFYPGTELNNDITNWWAPNRAGMEAMLRSAGFEPHLHLDTGSRAIYHCRKVARTTPSAQWAAAEFESVPLAPR